MSKVDWSLAPEGATHYCEGAMSGFWRDLSERTWKFYRDSDGTWHDSGDKVSSLLNNSCGLTLIERPKPKQWSGPQDGLPPIGMSFEFKGLKHRNQDYLYALKDWHVGDVVSVVAHVKLQGEMSALYWNEDKMSSSTVRPDLLERVKNTEQHASEQRETAIREIMDIADVDCRVTAAKLVDAGFKREVA